MRALTWMVLGSLGLSLSLLKVDLAHLARFDLPPRGLLCGAALLLCHRPLLCAALREAHSGLALQHLRLPTTSKTQFIVSGTHLFVSGTHLLRPGHKRFLDTKNMSLTQLIVFAMC